MHVRAEARGMRGRTSADEASPGRPLGTPLPQLQLAPLPRRSVPTAFVHLLASRRRRHRLRRLRPGPAASEFPIRLVNVLPVVTSRGLPPGVHIERQPAAGDPFPRAASSAAAVRARLRRAGVFSAAEGAAEAPVARRVEEGGGREGMSHVAGASKAAGNAPPSSSYAPEKRQANTRGATAVRLLQTRCSPSPSGPLTRALPRAGAPPPPGPRPRSSAVRRCCPRTAPACGWSSPCGPGCARTRAWACGALRGGRGMLGQGHSSDTGVPRLNTTGARTCFHSQGLRTAPALLLRSAAVSACPRGSPRTRSALSAACGARGLRRRRPAREGKRAEELLLRLMLLGRNGGPARRGGGAGGGARALLRLLRGRGGGGGVCSAPACGWRAGRCGCRLRVLLLLLLRRGRPRPREAARERGDGVGARPRCLRRRRRLLLLLRLAQVQRLLLPLLLLLESPPTCALQNKHSGHRGHFNISAKTGYCCIMQAKNSEGGTCSAPPHLWRHAVVRPQPVRGRHLVRPPAPPPSALRPAGARYGAGIVAWRGCAWRCNLTLRSSREGESTAYFVCSRKTERRQQARRIKRCP